MSKAVDAAAITAYLQDNPGFLLDNPELLSQLELAHASGGAASLIERQIDLLREKNQQMTLQLQQLVQVARDNEQLMARLHQLTLRLLPETDTQDFFCKLCEALQQEFSVDYIYLGIFDLQLDYPKQVYGPPKDEAELAKLRNLFKADDAVCGRMKLEKRRILFAEAAELVASSALIPLGESGHYGILALGSAEADRFYPGMGTLFLDLLANVIACHLDARRSPQQRSA